MAIDVDKIQKPLRKMGKLVRKMSGIPSLEDVHSVRTHTRQIEAAFSALGIDSNGRQRKLLDEMNKLRRRAGRVRDMDVLIGYSSSAHVAKEDQCAVELLEELGARRHRHARRLSNFVRRNRKKLLRKLKGNSKRVRKMLSGSDVDRIQKVSPAVAGSALSVAAELAQPKQLNKNNLHPYRLKIKQLRNILKLATDKTTPSLVNQLGELKDAIGTWHDWQVLVSIASKTLNHGSSCRLLIKLKEITEQKYREAVKLADEFRRLNPPNFSGTGRRRSKKISKQPILDAVAGLAA